MDEEEGKREIRHCAMFDVEIRRTSKDISMEDFLAVNYRRFLKGAPTGMNRIVCVFAENPDGRTDFILKLKPRKPTGLRCTRSCLRRCIVFDSLEGGALDIQAVLADERGCKFATYEPYYGARPDDLEGE